LLLGVAFHGERDIVTDGSSVESGVFLVHDPGDLIRWDLDVYISQSLGD
jgi:hypothetical protein